MIILKIILWLILALVLIVLFAFVVPVSINFSYIDKKLEFGVKYGFVNLFNSKKKGIMVKPFEKWRSRRKKKKESSGSDDDFSIEDDFPEIDETDEDFRNSDDYEEEAEEVLSRADEEHEEDKEQRKFADYEDDSEFYDDCEPSDDYEDEDEDDKIIKIFNKFEEIGNKVDKLLDILDMAEKPLEDLCRGCKFSRFYIDFLIADKDAFVCAMKYAAVSGGVYNILGWVMTIFPVKFKTVDIFPDFKKTECRWDISFRFSFTGVTVVYAAIYFLLTYIFKVSIPKKKKQKQKEKEKSEV